MVSTNELFLWVQETDGRPMVLYAIDVIALGGNIEFLAVLFLEDEMGGSLHGQDQAQRWVSCLLSPCTPIPSETDQGRGDSSKVKRLTCRLLTYTCSFT